MKDYYKVLNVSTDATKDEIKKAFRSLAKKYHPDRNANDKEALRKFQEVNEAYEVLSNEEARKQYDDKRKSGFKESSKAEGNNKNNKSSNHNRKYEDKSASMENLNKYFESFFGFNANTNDMNKDKLKNNKNPVDTSGMFESFFGTHSKK